MDNKETNKKLIEKYPFLLPVNVWTGKEVEGYDYSYNILEVSIPKGWWERFGLLWCQDFLEVCQKENVNPKNLYIMQAKKKYGQIRVYMSGYPKGWQEHEFAWEYISEHTCIRCGAFPCPMRDDGWISPKCDKCFAEDYPDEKNIDKWTIKDSDKLDEFISYTRYQDKKEEKILIDMKPYYKLLGYDFKVSNDGK